LTGNFRFDKDHQAYNFNVYMTINKKSQPIILYTDKINKP